MNGIIKAQLSPKENKLILELIESEIKGVTKRLEYYKSQSESKYAILASKKLGNLKVIRNKLRGEKF